MPRDDTDDTTDSPATGRRDRTRGSTRRRALKGAGALLLGGTLAGCGGDDGGNDGSENTVEMTDDLVFEPDSLSVTVGTSVVWENVGGVGHTVTAYEDAIPDDADYFASGEFDSEDAARGGYPSGGDIPGGERYEYTFETPGTYEYFCIPHESTMTGSIVVQDG